MRNGSERLDRIERILEQVAKSQQEMAARQQYHDEAFERHDAEMKRHDAEMKVIREAIAADAKNIRALVRIAELHHHRLERLEGGKEA
jgi:cell fate regulator YaaT (PSP1 superfamily)